MSAPLPLPLLLPLLPPPLLVLAPTWLLALALLVPEELALALASVVSPASLLLHKDSMQGVACLVSSFSLPPQFLI